MSFTKNNNFDYACFISIAFLKSILIIYNNIQGYSLKNPIYNNLLPGNKCRKLKLSMLKFIGDV